MPNEARPDDIKLDPKFHVPEENPDIHLQRLLAPQDLDEPFYKSIVKTFNNIIHPPPPLPPIRKSARQPRSTQIPRPS